MLNRDGLDIYDATSLRLESSRPLTGDWHLSPNGRVLYTLPAADGGSKRLSTVDGTALPTVVLEKNQILLRRSSDDHWWVTEEAIMQSRDGRKLEVQDLHLTPNCPHTSSPLVGVTAVETLPAVSGEPERLLLGYNDGFVEVRNAQGHLLNTFRAPGELNCSSIQTLLPLPGGQRVAYQRAWASREIGLLNLKSGATELLPEATLSGASVNGSLLTEEGVLYRTWSSGKIGDGHHFVGWEAGSWRLAVQDCALTLDVRTNRTGEWTADVTGTARLNGRSLEVRGTLDSGFDAKLKPQGRMFLPELRANLTLLDGTQVVAKVLASASLLEPGSSEAPRAPTYAVFLQEQATNSTFGGWLRRP
ncbi:hypothetical protein [Deinococcus apachensis]|uniref:hypothetical protein n=1 Tax=Deinococcus apachensis TaxID=309886 RepID=UPI00036ABF6E|nr:hypothetical protein [Deinococcus apachensis]